MYLPTNAYDQTDEGKYVSLILLNYQKSIYLNSSFNLTVGGQSGTEFEWSDQKSHFAGWFYTTISFKKDDDLRFTIGPWVGNRHYLKGDKYSGILTGLDYQLLKSKFHFVFDLISGSSPISMTSIGFSYFAKSNLPISLGLQKPTQKNNSNAIILEITLLAND